LHRTNDCVDTTARKVESREKNMMMFSQQLSRRWSLKLTVQEEGLRIFRTGLERRTVRRDCLKPAREFRIPWKQ
jgi:hypothetical protein